MQSKILQKCLSTLKSQWGVLYQKQVTNIMAYGSAAIAQTGDSKVINANTLDLLIQVKDSGSFHREMLQNRREEYGGLAWLFGPKMLEFSYKYVFPWHSNHIWLDGKKIKYSIVGQKELREDLKDWKYLSFAGRLHKAVIPLQPVCQGFESDLKVNRQAALSVALLLATKNKKMNVKDIFHQIVQLSYTGDIRITAGAENPKKVENIVTHGWKHIHGIYYPMLFDLYQKYPGLTLRENEFKCELTLPLLSELIRRLPTNLHNHLTGIYGESNLIEKVAAAQDLEFNLIKYIEKTNAKSSISMLCQNILTASPVNNIQYLMAKLQKARKAQ